MAGGESVSALAQAVAEYLELRRGLGYKLEREGRLLPDFVVFLVQEGGSYITAEHARRWAMAPAQATPKWWHTRLGMVRQLARYMLALDPRTEVPSRELLPPPSREKLMPYVYTDEDIKVLMRAARTLRGFRGATYATLFGLLAVTGMRVGEALRLDRSDVDWHERVLLIRHTKFGKSREVPLHPSSLHALRTYAAERDRVLPSPRSPSFFLSLAGTRLHYKNVHFYFLRLLDRAGLTDRRPHRPRIADLRHTFAIRTVADGYRSGIDGRARLATLSTYLGHVCPSRTYWYLTAARELLEPAADRLERAWGALP
jgi:integrase